jgi:sulfatase modifying factor 1
MRPFNQGPPPRAAGEGSTGSGAAVARVAILAVVALTVPGCHRRAAPAGNWQEQRDGILCRHPEVVADCRDGWCRVPAGCYVKGSPPDEWGHAAFTEEQRAVTLTHGLLVGEHEVTQGEWRAMGLPDPSAHLPAGGGDCTDDPRCPVGNVTWSEAVAFANRLSAAASPPLPACYELHDCTGQLGRGMTCSGVSLTTRSLADCAGYRLPTDAEWEYVARAGTRTATYAGELPALTDYSNCSPIPALERTAWYCANSGRVTHPVAQKQANGWGVFDLLGNAHEWIHDGYDGQPPPPGPLRDPGGLAVSSPNRLMRGGGATSWSHLLRSSCGALNLPFNQRAPTVGFRLVRTLSPPRAASGHQRERGQVAYAKIEGDRADGAPDHVKLNGQELGWIEWRGVAVVHGTQNVGPKDRVVSGIDRRAVQRRSIPVSRVLVGDARRRRGRELHAKGQRAVGVGNAVDVERDPGYSVSRGVVGIARAAGGEASRIDCQRNHGAPDAAVVERRSGGRIGDHLGHGP